VGHVAFMAETITVCNILVVGDPTDEIISKLMLQEYVLWMLSIIRWQL
jgi:hypothetical protein